MKNKAAPIVRVGTAYILRNGEGGSRWVRWHRRNVKRWPGESVHLHLRLSILSLKYAIYASRHAKMQEKAQFPCSKHSVKSNWWVIHKQSIKMSFWEVRQVHVIMKGLTPARGGTCIWPEPSSVVLGGNLSLPESPRPGLQAQGYRGGVSCRTDKHLCKGGSGLRRLSWLIFFVAQQSSVCFILSSFPFPSSKTRPTFIKNLGPCEALWSLMVRPSASVRFKEMLVVITHRLSSVVLFHMPLA